MHAENNAQNIPIMLTQLLNGGLESALNYLIRRTPECEYHLRKLNGKSLQITLSNFSLSAVLFFSAKQVDVLKQYGETADCQIEFNPQKLRRIPKKSELSQLINDKTLILHGDLQVLQDFASLLEHLEKDPAELLSPYIGDVIAQSAVDLGKKSWQFLTSSIATSQRHWGERLTEEYRLLAPPLAVADFCDQVKELEQACLRFEEKFEQICVNP